MYHIIGADNREYGPITPEQMREWIVQRRVNAQTRTKSAGAADWKALADFPEVRRFANELGMTSIVVVMALLARAAGESSRSAQRLARAVLGGVGGYEVASVMLALGLAAARDELAS